MYFFLDCPELYGELLRRRFGCPRLFEVSSIAEIIATKGTPITAMSSSVTKTSIMNSFLG